MRRLATVFRSIENRDYRLYFFGQLVSLLGSWLQSVAQAWLVYRLTGSAFQLGLVIFIGQAPLLFLSPAGGLIADRYRRRWVVVGTQSFSMLLAFALGALTLLGLVQMWEILILAGLQGVITAFDVPARQALVSGMVDPEDLLNAVALNSSLFNNASSVAPLVAGFLVAAVGEGWCFVINGLTYLAVIGGLVLMRVEEHRTREGMRSALARIREGFHFVHDTAPIRRVLVVLALVSLLGAPFTVLMPIFADQVLHTGPRGLGLLMSANGIGSLIGSLLLASRRGLSGLGRWVVFGSAGFGASLVLFASSRSFSLSLLILAVAGFCMFYELTASNTLIQAMSPEALRGRAIAILSMLVLGVAPFGALTAGFLARLLGAPLTCAIGGMACLAGALVCSVNLPALAVEGRQLIAANLALAPSGRHLQSSANAQILAMKVRSE
jgi:MFS family permease